jgi:copper chaperone
MTCGHCVSAITKAVKAADKDAKVQVDLANHRVDIEPTESDVAELRDAIKEAGYTPVLITAPNGVASEGTLPKSGGCGCGSSRSAPVGTLETAVPAKNSCCS